MTSLSNRIAIIAIKVVGADRHMTKALAAEAAPNARPPARLSRRHAIKFEVYDGRGAWHILPKDGVTADRVLYHWHGGGFILGMPKAFYAAYGRLADMTGCRVIAPDYPLPPKSTGAEIRSWSAAHYAGICAQYGADNIVLSGDSAGANLALRLAQTGPVPAKLLLWSPWADLSHRDPAQDKITTEPLLDMPTIRAAAERYAGNDSLLSADVSPIFGDMRGLPPMVIYSGSLDLFHGDITRLHGVMTEQGAKVRFHVAQGLTHDYMYLPTPEAKATLRDIAGEIIGL